MKKLVILCLLLVPSIASAQNLQYHYDFGKEHSTVTFEAFKPDSKGSLFAFADFDLNADDGSTSLVHWEVVRHFDFGWKVKPTIQYEDTLANFGSLNSAVLAGVNWLGVDFLYRHDQDAGSEAQITKAWCYRWGDLEASGFVDIWTDDGEVRILSDPGFWYHFGNIAIGTELEVARNFYFDDESSIDPTIGVKVTW